MRKYTTYNIPAKGKKKASKKRIIIPILLGLALLSGLLFVLDRKGVINLPFLSDNKPMQTTPDGINYGPPTEQEKTETEQHKDSLGDQSKSDTPSTSSSSSTTGKKTVSPLMTSWIADPDVEVRGYVPGVNEEGGTCTLTLTKDGQKVTESKTGISDVNTVNCGLITVARSRLSAGKWTAELSYFSKSSEGTSTSSQVEVK